MDERVILRIVFWGSIAGLLFMTAYSPETAVSVFNGAVETTGDIFATLFDFFDSLVA